jgi:hypothetical protein
MAMKELRRIKFTGKNLNDVFALPCVDKIVKIINRPQLVINPSILLKTSSNVANIGDELVEYEDEQWEIVRNNHERRQN